METTRAGSGGHGAPLLESLYIRVPQGRRQGRLLQGQSLCCNRAFPVERSAALTIAVYTHEDCLRHDPGAQHPENPRRLEVVLDALRTSSLAGALSLREAPLGSDEQVLLAHTPAHLRLLRKTAPAQGRAPLDGDTVMSPGSLDAALRAVGAACLAV